MWVLSLTNPTSAQQAVGVYLEDDRDKDEALSTFIAAIASAGPGQTIPIVVVRNRPNIVPPALLIRRTEAQTWQIEPVPPQRLPRSPLLPESPGITIDVSSSDENLGLLIDGLLTYSNGECSSLIEWLMQRAASISLNTQSAMHYYLGHCLVAERSFGEAIEQYRHSIASAPAITWQQQSALAWALLSADQQAESAALIDELVMSQDFITSDMLALRAYYYLLIFNTDRATQDALKALAGNPNHVEYLVLNGQIALARYEWDEALMWLNRARRIDPNDADANYYLGILYYTRADRTTAARFFARVMQSAPLSRLALSAHRYLVLIRREIEALKIEE